jgi:hypothetical protein
MVQCDISGDAIRAGLERPVAAGCSRAKIAVLTHIAKSRSHPAIDPFDTSMKTLLPAGGMRCRI